MNKRLCWVFVLLAIAGAVELAIYMSVQRRHRLPPQIIGTRVDPEVLKGMKPPEPVPNPTTRPPDDAPRPRPASWQPVSLSTPMPTLADLRAAVKDTNLLIVVLDAARADHFGAYGYPRDTTPNFDRLAQESVVFENHFCQFPHTTCSTASLFTSQYPDTHGMVFNTKDDFRDSASVVDPNAFTIEKGLEGAGFATYLFTANRCASPQLGVGGDFQEVKVIEKPRPMQDRASRMQARQRRGSRQAMGLNRTVPPLLDAVRQRVEEMCSYRFFAYVHLLPPHMPYEAPQSYRERYEGKRAPDFYAGEAAFTRVYYRTWGDAAPASGEPWVNLYDANLRWGDQALEDLLGMLREAGVLDDTLLIVTSDHGEALGEHRYEFHMTCPYEEALRIPLLIRFPGGKGPVGRVRALTETVDILPTLMDLYGISYPKGEVQGESLVPLLTGERGELREYAFSRTGGLYPCYVVRSHDWSLLLYRGGKMRALYDLQNDPCERYNVIDSRRDQAERMAAAFREFARQQRSPPLDFLDPNYKPKPARELPRTKLSDETKRDLKALGYID